MLFPILYVAGMVFYDFATQHVAVNVCVNFCCRYRFVSQHTLYGAQVGASLEEMGGKRVAESVRADVFGDACLHGQLLDDVENHDT